MHSQSAKAWGECVFASWLVVKCPGFQSGQLEALWNPQLLYTLSTMYKVGSTMSCPASQATCQCFVHGLSSFSALKKHLHLHCSSQRQNQKTITHTKLEKVHVQLVSEEGQMSCNVVLYANYVSHRLQCLTSTVQKCYFSYKYNTWQRLFIF